MPAKDLKRNTETEFVLWHRTEGAGVAGHQLAVVAYRGGELYCLCTEQRRGSREQTAKEEGDGPEDGRERKAQGETLEPSH